MAVRRVGFRGSLGCEGGVAILLEEDSTLTSLPLERGRFRIWTFIDFSPYVTTLLALSLVIHLALFFFAPF